MKGKAVFTKSEVDAIIKLINQKLMADSTEQKHIRDRVRAIGFYASDFAIGGGYNVDDFLRVVTVDGKMPLSIPEKPENTTQTKVDRSKVNDEAYIISLCDELLKFVALRQYRFDFLKGDSGVRLPVDAYYPELKLVVEYRERQHTENVKFFNRRQTVSCVNRGEQRRIYDQRRRDLLPANGIKLIEFGYDDFQHNHSKRLLQEREKDVQVLTNKLKVHIK